MNNIFRVIIAGCRDFKDEQLLIDTCDKLLSDKVKNGFKIEIVSGNCPSGADRYGEIYARNRGYYLKLFKANWDLHGLRAGPIRNEDMARYADACICFWDQKSRGTQSMISLAKKHKLQLRVINY